MGPASSGPAIRTKRGRGGKKKEKENVLHTHRMINIIIPLHASIRLAPVHFRHL